MRNFVNYNFQKKNPATQKKLYQICELALEEKPIFCYNEAIYFSLSFHHKAVLQYKIPQDVQIEDKILGPLTLKQLIIVAVGGGISYSIFLFMSEYFFLSFIDYFWICIPLILSLAFAFIRVNNVTFLKWLLLLFEFLHNARRRRWDKTTTTQLHYAFVTAKTGTSQKEKDEKTAAKKQSQQQKKGSTPGKKQTSSLQELTHVLDHHSRFHSVDQSREDDHEDDYALHASAAEKERHEERLEKLIQNSASPATSSSDNANAVSFQQMQQGGGAVSFG